MLDPEDEEEELPEDIDDASLYLEMPSKIELDLGRNLVFSFVEAEAPQLLDAVELAFQRRGAYARFKGLIERNGLLERWYAYEAEATRRQLELWAQENGLLVVD